MHLVQTYFKLKFSLFSFDILLFSKHVKLILVLHKGFVTERFKYFTAGAILNGKTEMHEFGKNSSTNRCSCIIIIETLECFLFNFGLKTEHLQSFK